MSVVANGEWAGVSLAELCQKLGADLVGSKIGRDGFPLLVKIIDANQRLSVQVHPSDANASFIPGAEPKTEMWYALAADPGARVFAGLKPGTDRAALERAIAANRAEDVLQSYPISPGDAIFVPGGRVHAICEGCLLLEVQQSSDTTFRLYDWGRVDSSGKPRQLHLEEAWKTIAWDDSGPVRFNLQPVSGNNDNTIRTVFSCDYFSMGRFDLVKPCDRANNGKSFHAYFVLGGAMDIAAGSVKVRCEAGTSVLIPAGLARYRLDPVHGRVSALGISV